MDKQLAALRDTVNQLTTRVEALEKASIPSDGSDTPDNSGTAEDAGAFWALDELKRRTRAGGTTDGSVMLVGALQTPDGPVEWQENRSTTALLETDWTDHAASFSSLGSPVRLELLRHILNGTHRTADLAAIDHLGTTGQLHHHLRQLVAAGWVRQAERGSYEIPAARIVPLLACLAGAMQ